LEVNLVFDRFRSHYRWYI